MRCVWLPAGILAKIIAVMPPSASFDRSSVRFDDRGLLTTVVEHAHTGEVLMVGWMNEESLARTLDSALVWFWSRSRGRLWQKGESSGHVLAVRNVFLDCDGDTLLVKALPAGPTCHTGSRSCFGTPGAGTLDALEATVAARAALPPGAHSYVRRLLDEGPEKIAAKLREEAGELGAELAAGAPARVVAEAADLLFHVLVALRSRGVPVADVLAELERRHGTSGLDEKAARTGP